MEKPERYVVYWFDWAQCASLAKKRSVPYGEIEPDEFCEMVDFVDLNAARAFCSLKESTGAYIEERINLRKVYDPPLVFWDWDQQRID